MALKAGFVTPSAFPPRKLAHAKVSPLERKRPPPGASVRRPTLYNIWYNFLIILSIIQLHVYYKEHTSKLLTLNSESVILWSS